ncbi:hypothetical protein C5167_035469 [Papaver somniferum]|uniref:Uncharacterized protein n=1 Tax=Papaver somniferum TaxID=3469 RepID=A0A4Y7KJS7_PAPSO|nr:hypothetical protein C5167_035469 [Papaver somniferum]
MSKQKYYQQRAQYEGKVIEMNDASSIITTWRKLKYVVTLEHFMDTQPQPWRKRNQRLGSAVFIPGWWMCPIKRDP